MAARDAKQRISGALLALLQTKPLEDVTVKELVSKAGVNRSTFYYHFYRVEDVIDYISELFLNNARAATTFEQGYQVGSEGEPQAAVDGASRFFAYIYQNREQLCAVVNSPQREGFYKKLVDLFVEQYRGYSHWWLQDGKLVPMRQRDRAYSTRCWAYLTIGAIEEWRLREFEETPEELSRLVWHIFTNVRGSELRVS